MNASVRSSERCVAHKYGLWQFCRSPKTRYATISVSVRSTDSITTSNSDVENL